MEDNSQPTIHHPDISLDKGSLPDFKIKLKYDTSQSSIFGLVAPEKDISKKQELK
jgi:hypothetical protein